MRNLARASELPRDGQSQEDVCALLRLPNEGEMRINGDVAICQRIHLGTLKAYFGALPHRMKLAALDKPQKCYAMAVEKRSRLVHRQHG